MNQNGLMVQDTVTGKVKSKVNDKGFTTFDADEKEAVKLSGGDAATGEKPSLIVKDGDKKVVEVSKEKGVTIVEDDVEVISVKYNKAEEDAQITTKDKTTGKKKTQVKATGVVAFDADEKEAVKLSGGDAATGEKPSLIVKDGDKKVVEVSKEKGVATFDELEQEEVSIKDEISLSKGGVKRAELKVAENDDVELNLKDLGGTDRVVAAAKGAVPAGRRLGTLACHAALAAMPCSSFPPAALLCSGEANKKMMKIGESIEVQGADGKKKVELGEEKGVAAFDDEEKERISIKVDGTGKGKLDAVGA
jgi:hypothetical protein